MQVVKIQIRPHRLVKTRLVWQPLNRLQAWLEGEDKFPAKAVGYGVLAVTGLFLVGQVVRWIV